uniref:Ig-like domain-containing protein n=1 Tax=Dromaius novaehollandiae TaxID=8790 RepID=A0A8C4KTT1_DRONO
MDVFGGAPRFLAYPRTFTVQNGADAVLKCQIAGDPRPSILWEKDRTPIEPSGRFHVEAKGNMYSLLVSRVTSEDSGLYICKAKNNVGETYAAAMLKVEAGEPSSMRVCRGEDVMFTCRVSGQPCPVLHWEKDGHELSDLFESSHFSVGKEPEDWHFLKLFGARPPDGGVYVCRARSGSREALAAAVLLVEPLAPGLPDEQSHESPGNGLEHAGKHAKFRCYVTGKPKPEIVWKKDGKPITPGRRHLVYEDREGYFILKVLYCKPQDQGLYICTASNTAGQTLSAVQLQVKGRYRIVHPAAKLLVLEGGSAVLSAVVSKEAAPISWLGPWGAAVASERCELRREGRVHSLVLGNARRWRPRAGGGACQCVGLGRATELLVKFLRGLADVHAHEGETVVLWCELCKAKGDVVWLKDGRPLAPGARREIKAEGRERSLVLSDVRPEDAGEYCCESNDDRTLATLTVQGEPQGPACPTASPVPRGREGTGVPSNGRARGDAWWPCRARSRGGSGEAGHRRWFGEMGHPSHMTQGRSQTILLLHRPRGSALNSLIFLMWLLPPRGGPVGITGLAPGIVAPLRRPARGNKSPGGTAPPRAPRPPRSPQAAWAPKGSLLCGRGLSSVWHIYKRD